MLSDDLLDLLCTWWLAGREKGVMLPGGWLFPGQNPVNHLTPRQLSRIFHGAKDAAGIDKQVSLHTLRHCLATHILEQKVDIRKPLTGAVVHCGRGQGLLVDRISVVRPA